MPKTSRPHRPVLLLALLSSVLCHCTRLVDSDRVQCSVDQDCAKRGGAFAGSVCVNHFCSPPQVTEPPVTETPDAQAPVAQTPDAEESGPWSCLGHVVWPTSGSGTAKVTMELSDIISSEPVPGVGIQVCHKLDSTCASPLHSNLVSDSSGRVTFSVPMGFTGYAASTSGGIMPFIYFFNPPVTSDREVPSVPMLKTTALATFATLAGGTIMPDRGHVMARVYNCLGQTAEGIRLSSPESDSATTPFSMIKGAPSTKLSATDGSGNAGLLNLPVGTVTLTGKLENGETMGTVSVVTMVGRMTYLALVPAPR